MNATAAACTLWDAWLERRAIDGLPDDCRPRDLQEGYAIQAELDALAGRRVGWKIAATGAGGRAALGVEHPIAGPLYERFAVVPGGEADFSALHMGIVEAEFGFLVARDLPAAAAPFDRSTVLAAIGAFVPAIEMPDTRYTDHRAAGGPQVVADASCAGLFVLGPPLDLFDPESLPAAAVTLTANGAAGEGTGGNVLGDPVEALRWLANELAAHGRGLAAGETVITGSAVAVRRPGLGPVVADFGALGTVELSLA
jgi:2-keto-4-pentenoate hydratase